MANLLSTTVNGQLNTGNVIDLGYTVNGSIATTAFRGINFHSFSDYNYLIGKRAGAWTQPLDITFYTGIKYHAHRAYGGHKFYTGGFDSDFALSIGDGDNLVRVADRIIVDGTMNVNYDQVWTSSGNLHLQYSSSGNIDMNYGGGYAFSRTSLRAPIFYDYNDTGYYLDPNGTSNLLQLTTATRARWNMPRVWYDRSSRTSDQGYWTGTNGWTTDDGTWANAWKGGFSGWDIWGSNTDHPQGAGGIHAQGIVSGIHYSTSDGGEAYGWMMVGANAATENRYWLRGKWGTSTSGWVEMITTGNIGSQSVNYASSAGNADTLDSLDSSEFARGRASYQVLNLDTIKQPGLYQYDGGIGGTQPEGTDQYNLRTIEIGSGGRYSQMAFDWASEQAWFRRQTGDTWSTWREFIHSGNIGSQSVNYASSAGSVAWNNVTSKPSLDYQQEYTFTAPASTDGSGYSWVRVSMGGFNSGGDFVRFSIGRAIFWNDSNPYGGPSMDVVAYSREWHGGQEGAVITYAEHGSVPGSGWITHAGPRDLAGGGYWFYMRVWERVDYVMRVYRGSGPIGTSWESTSDPGIVFPIRLGVNNIGAQHTGFNTNGAVHASTYYDYDDTGYYLNPSSESKLKKIWINNGGAAGVGWSTGLNMGDGSNYWNLIQDAGTARQRNFGAGGYDWYSNGGTQLMILSNAGNLSVAGTITTQGNSVITSGNIASQSVSYADESGFASSAGSVEWTNVQNKPSLMPISGIPSGSDQYVNLRVIGNFNAGSGSGMHIGYGNQNGGDTLLYGGGGYSPQLYVYGDHVYSPSSFRAPIFYDSNDTYYYVDPNSMSRISSARIVGGELRFHNGSYYSDLNYWGARFYSQDDGNGVPLYVQVQWVDGWRTSLKIASGIDDNNPSLRTYGRTQLATDGGFVGIATTSPFAELDVNGRLAVRGGNRLYWGATTTLGSWTTAQYASGSTHLFNAQRFDFTNEGYGSTTFAIINSEGVYTNNSILFPQTQFSPSAGSRTLTPPMSIRMFDNYFSGIGLGSDYGTVLEYYSRIGHVDTQVYFDAAGGSWYRTAQYAGGYSAWNQYITSGNIGSQNVNASNYQYATGSSSDAIASFRQTPAHATSFREISSSGPGGTWWMIQNFRHSNSSNYWGTQVAWGWEDNALRLMQRNVSADSWSGWVEYLNTNNAAYAWNMNQHVRTSDAVTFASTTTQTFLIASHSDNTKGYRIYNTSNSSVSAMFVNSSNQLVIAAGAVDQVNLNKKVLVNGVALGVNVAPSATAGRIDASNDIVAYSSSDERLKHNIAPIENALDKVKSLTGVEFDWKPEYKHAHGYEGHDTGIIAQQVEAVMPSAVRTNDTGFLAVRYEKLIGLLIEGMKEQQAQINELKSIINGLTT